MRKTISLQKLYSKFQPIKATAPEWTFDTLVRLILKRYTTATGKVIYLVEFRDGSRAKVSARSLYKRNVDLVETFEHKRLLALESPDEGDEDYLPPKRRTRSELPVYATLPPMKKIKRRKKKTPVSTPTTPIRSVPRSTPSPIPPRSAASTPPIRTSSEDLSSKQQQQQLKFKITVRSPSSRSPPHSNNCYQCKKMDTLPLVPCKLCNFSFHTACNKNDGSACHLCQTTNGPTCTICHEANSKVILFRCQECKRAMHDACTKYTNDICNECQSYHGKEIEKCLGEKDEKALVKWKNKENSHWVASSWVQSKYPDIYKNKSMDRNDWEVESILDMKWKDHRSPSYALVLYKNMKKSDAVWESAIEGNQSFDNALKIYRENNINNGR